MAMLLDKLMKPAFGLAAEAIAHRREKKSCVQATSDTNLNANDEIRQTGDEAVASSSSGAAPAAPAEYTVTAAHGPSPENSRQASSSGEESDDGNDEDDWELDEASENANPPARDETLEEDDMPALTRSVLLGAPAPTGARLSLPVVLPQRRPRSKGRGFVRAYAPVLDDIGVDQATFMRFLEAFHASSKASKTLDVIMISAAIAGFAPSVIAMAVSTAVQIAAGTAKELQTRTRTNNFLDEMNVKLFMPRGVIAMIMTFKPDTVSSGRGRGGAIGSILGAVGGLVTHKEMDMNQTIAKYYMNDGVSGVKKTMRDLRLSSGKTRGELSLPESAPLVYPSLEEVASAVAEGQDGDDVKNKESKFKRSGKFVADYFDRRSQAQYAAENPGSALAGEPLRFASRLADPGHGTPTQGRGGLIGSLTGGALGLGGLRAGRRAHRGARLVGRGVQPRRSRQQQQQGTPGYSPQGIKRIMQKDVLYLTIVNIPSDEELREAISTLNGLQTRSSREE